MNDLSVIKNSHIVIDVSYLGENGNFGAVKAVEKSITVNGSLVYKEWQSWPQYHHKANTSVVLNELEKQLSFKPDCNTSKQGIGDTRNFIKCFKVFWAKLLFKRINLES